MTELGLINNRTEFMTDRLTLLKKFGTKVRMRRFECNISQMKLAELVGCSLQAIGNIERGQANPSLIMLYRISDALQINPKDIIP